MMRLLACLLCWAGLTGCLSFGPDDEVPSVRWFSAHVGDWDSAQLADGGSELVFGSASSAEHLGGQIAWSRDELEYGFYDLLRWTEPPVEFLTRAMQTAYPRRQPAGSFQHLHARLEAFEERWQGGERLARVRVHVRVSSASGEQSYPIEVQRPVQGSGALPLAAALRDALREVVLEMGR